MKLPAELEQYGLVRPTRQVKRRLVLTAEAGPKAGKSRLFYATAPRPALVIQLDQNDEHLREQYADDENFFIQDVIMPPFMTHDEEQRKKDFLIYKKVREVYGLAVKGGVFRSIMIDEGAALYELVRRSFLVGLGFGESSQTSYSSVNAAMDRFYTLAKHHRVNLYIPHRQTDERESIITGDNKKGSAPTGRMKAAGWKNSLYTSQCHVLLEKNVHFNHKLCGECGLPRTSNGKAQKCSCDTFSKQSPYDKFTCKIIHCSNNAKVEGRVLKGSEITWQSLGQLVFPQSTEEEWAQ